MFKAVLRLQPLAIVSSKDEGTGESDVTTMVRSATRGMEWVLVSVQKEAGSAGVSQMYIAKA